MASKIRVKKSRRTSVKSANVGGFMKKHPHRTRVKGTRRKAKSAGVKGYLKRKA